MPTQFPGTKDNFLNPIGTDLLENAEPRLEHSTQHANANDAIEALEAKVGIDTSADSNSLDSKVRNGGAIRKTASVTSDTLAAGATDSAKTVALGKGGIAIKISTNYPAWVRVYASATAQSADAAREITVDPVAGSGVLLEVLTSGEIILSPTAVLFSASGVSALPVTITNKDTVSRAITAIITTVPIEG